MKKFKYKSLRGGSWFFMQWSCTASSSLRYRPDGNHLDDIGFRVVKQTKQEQH
jgi:formylglycine-generating enzyme required for sulfatase activity